MRYDLGYLDDPTVFAVNRLPAVSDHQTFLDEREALAGSSSLRLSLDGKWKFSYAETLKTRAIGFEAPEADVSSWQEINVPGHMQLQGYGTPQYVNIQYPWDGHEALTPPQLPQRYQPVGSYVRFFTCPKSWRDMRVTLTFHGVESAFFVWLNGALVGYSEDSFTPSRFDITDLLTAGENRLAVEVFRFSTGSWLEDQDFWRFSGIFRSVELRAQPLAHVEDIFAHAEPEGIFGAELLLSLPQGKTTLDVALLGAGNAPVAAFSMPAEEKMSFSRAIEHPLLWSAEEPNLYTLRLTLKDEQGNTAEVAQTRLGFRHFEIRHSIMYLNGKRILFHGVDRHEFSCKTGRAISEAEMRWDIETLKRHNVNAVRLSHYPNQTRFYELCDEYGLYLMDETNLETHGTWSRGGRYTPETALPGDQTAWRDMVVDRAKSMLERDKNHPSVLIWSCGNESFGGRDIFEMSEFLRARDPSRPVHYESTFHDRRYNRTSDIESRMYPPVSEIQEYLRAHTDKPFILCEYTHAMGNSCGGMALYRALEDEFEQFQGGFVWDMIDQALETVSPSGKRRLASGGDFGDRPSDRNFCTNGLIFADRTLSPKMQEVKYLFQDVRLYPDDTGVTLDNRALFAGTEKYELHFELTKDGQPVQQGQISSVDVPAGTKKHISLPLAKMDEQGEYALLCRLCLKEAAPWADKGYPLMHGQAVLKSVPKKTPDETPDYQIARGDMNIGAHNERFEALFSLVEGGLNSYGKPFSKPIIGTVPALSLWRAPNDNDHGNGDERKMALWQAFSVFAGAQADEIETTGALAITYRYTLPYLEHVVIRVRYEVLCGTKIRVTMDFEGAQKMPDLASFGLSIRLLKEYGAVRYYGFGPEENYQDRKSGAWLGIHQTTAQNNLTPYIKPQFCGNRTGVRWMELVNAQGSGLRVQMETCPLEISVLPCSQSALQQAKHQDELPVEDDIYVDVAMARMGVGGDDSWGAPVLPPYHLPSAKHYRFSFLLELLS